MEYKYSKNYQALHSWLLLTIRHSIKQESVTTRTYSVTYYKAPRYGT